MQQIAKKAHSNNIEIVIDVRYTAITLYMIQVMKTSKCVA